MAWERDPKFAFHAMLWFIPGARHRIMALIDEEEAEAKLRVVCPPEYLDDMLDLAEDRLARSRERSMTWTTVRAMARVEALDSVFRQICLGELP